VLTRYEVRLAGQPDENSAAAFAGLDMTCDAAVTVISGTLDQAALHGTLERIRLLGLDLIEVRQVRGPRPHVKGRRRPGKEGR
jgi:hypothetical protein